MILDRPIIVVDLFCGIGGATVGFILGGAKVVLAVDNWIEALKVHEHNFPDIPTLCIELGGDLPEIARLIKDALPSYDFHFHLHGSPPCTDISQANSKSDPEKGMILVNWFFELVDLMKPDSWSMENVIGVGKRIKGRRSYEVVNSADYGVPQTRKRVFAGEGWTLIPSHSKDEWVGVVDALPHLIDEGFERLQLPPSPSQVRLLLDGQRSKGSYSGVIDPVTGRRKWRNLAPIWREITDPSYTVMRTPRRILIGNEEERKTLRSLTLEESLIIQGFPSSFELVDGVKKTDLRIMVGNAVCPPVAKAIIQGVGG